jgi:hypothetical protein
MIAFECKQCHKRHARPDSQAGTLVFCDCGQGNRVPWDGGLAPTDLPEAIPVPTQPARPRAVPASAPPALPSRPAEDRRAEPALPSRRPDRSFRKINPAFCLQHDEAAAEATCDACKLPFCKLCVVALGGQTLCGSCKNFRIAGLGRPPRVLPLAVVSLVVALVSGPVTLILSLVAMGLYVGEGAVGPAVGLCLLALSLPVCGLWLAGLSLRRIEILPQTGGRALASSAACAALLGVLWCAVVMGLVLLGHVQGGG